MNMGARPAPVDGRAVLTSHDDYRADQVYPQRVWFAQGNIFEVPEYRQLSNIRINQFKLCRF